MFFKNNLLYIRTQQYYIWIDITGMIKKRLIKKKKQDKPLGLAAVECIGQAWGERAAFPGFSQQVCLTVTHPDLPTNTSKAFDFSVRLGWLRPGPDGQVIVFQEPADGRAQPYNTKTGRFTCQVPGLYQFHFNCILLDSEEDVRLMRNTEPQATSIIARQDSYLTASGGAVLLLKRGDKVWLQGSRGGGGLAADSLFTGHLLFAVWWYKHTRVWCHSLQCPAIIAYLAIAIKLQGILHFWRIGGLIERETLPLTIQKYGKIGICIKIPKLQNRVRVIFCLYVNHSESYKQEFMATWSLQICRHFNRHI